MHLELLKSGEVIGVEVGPALLLQGLLQAAGRALLATAKIMPDLKQSAKEEKEELLLLGN